MALYRLIGAAILVLAAGCQDAPGGASTRRGVVDGLPEIAATADVDARATLALKQDLVTRFPQNSDGAIVEAGLKKDGYACTPNPSAPTERACLKVAREAACEINTIVRTQPYAPEKAQVIKICALEKSPTPKPKP